MFHAPPDVQAEVFARIPEHPDHRRRTPAFVARQFHGAATPSFIEGPAFDRDGNLWLVDIPWGRIFRLTPGGTITQVAEYDGEPNALEFHADGRIFVADHKHGILTLDPATGAVAAVCDRPNLERFKGVNDLVFSSRGDLYFTDQGQTGLQDPSGRLYRLTAEGRLDCLLDNVPSPNGLVLSGDERFVFLAVTRGNAIWRVPLTPEGGVTKVGVFIQLSGGVGPDGLAIDDQNNLAICHVGLGSVWLFNAYGEPVSRIRAPEGRAVTNCAFGGPDGKTLYITESSTGSVLTVSMPHPGQPKFGLSL